MKWPPNPRWSPFGYIAISDAGRPSASSGKYATDPAVQAQFDHYPPCIFPILFLLLSDLQLSTSLSFVHRMESNIPRVNGKMLPRVTYFPDSFHEINGAAYKLELRCLCQTPPFTILVCG